jgi:hypothetical protein
MTLLAAIDFASSIKFVLVTLVVCMAVVLLITGGAARLGGAQQVQRKPCRSCGGENPGFARFCRHCGAAFSSDEQRG